MSSSAIPSETARSESDARLFRKIAFRILPLLFVSYCVAFLDRVNVGFTQLQMGQSLGIGAAQYGSAAGLFFLTYALFELPSNMLFEWLGARKTFLRIMMLWGLTVVATAFVTTPMQFYIARLLLGVFEAGFFPGMILYLTYWFPSTQRARVTAIVFLANALASTIVGPLSGAIMTWCDGAWGLQGWQWVFVIQGLPACVLGVACFFFLVDRPQDATWLNPSEKATLLEQLRRDATAAPGTSRHALVAVFRDPAVYLLAFLYFVPTCVNYLFNFWLPTMIRDSGVAQIMNIGLLTTIPMLCGIAGLITINMSSDLWRERRWHISLCFLLTALGLLSSVWLHESFVLMLGALCVASFGMTAIGPLFWTLPPTYLQRETAPAGIALVSMLGITAGFISPTVVGVIREQTGGFTLGIYAISALLLLCLPLLLWVVPERAMRVGAASMH